MVVTIKKKLEQLYLLAEEKIYYYTTLQVCNSVEATLKYNMLWYWIGKRDAYYTLLKGREK